jgi:HD-GYP domain-containing protein (c-di-GMP phosphodiesterase class II)
VKVVSKLGSAEQRDRDAQTQHSRVWNRRPALSRALRFAVFAGPIAGSFGVAALLSHVLPRADSVGTRVLWIAVIIVASLVTLVALERAARQLLPLAALLNLSLTFPDKAPARFALARRTGNPRDLRASLKQARESGHEDEATRMQTVIELVLALSVYDPASRGHSERVRVFTDLLTKELKIPDSGRNRLRWAALLHDIGKLEVPSAILKKPGKPTEEEWISLRRHPEEGARLVAPLLPWLGEWGLAVVQHHERFDGTGYPNRLKGQEISLAARIVSVADSYEVMTAPRNYKRQMSVSVAKQELVRCAGTQFDPAIVRAFLNVSVGRLWRTIGFGAWIAQVPTLGRLFSFGGFGGLAGSGVATGIASAAIATVLAVAGVVGPAPGPSVTGPAGTSTATASAPSHGAAPTMPNTLPGQPGFVAPTMTGSAPPAPGAPTPTVAPTARPTPAPGPTTTPRPTSPPTATTPPVPTPPVPTPPVPTPDPWSCAACTNTSPACSSYCSGSNLQTCVTYCSGNNNTVCISHCFGNNNKACLDYCQGKHNPQCLPPNCRNAAGVALAAVEIRARGLLAAIVAVGVSIFATPPPAVQPVAALT